MTNFPYLPVAIQAKLARDLMADIWLGLAIPKLVLTFRVGEYVAFYLYLIQFAVEALPLSDIEDQGYR